MSIEQHLVEELNTKKNKSKLLVKIKTKGAKKQKALKDLDFAPSVRLSKGPKKDDDSDSDSDSDSDDEDDKKKSKKKHAEND